MALATKIFGWVLLLAGVAVIGWTLYSSYNIFTGKAALPEIFEMPTEEAEAPVAKGGIPTTQQETQKELEKMIGEQLKGILPVAALPKLLNLIVWSILAGILIFGGSQISGLGIKLMKRG
ncbi:hypothetical protein GW869_00910 [bacterium]|uniref:Uncharacterized protein n=2 Tax=Candidatus Nealsoniibacteriota TaxID=1817911 RepID=A0A2M7EC61_9BACT|nr:hypothetical protein [bacterium]PIV65333.1 MAG: hypothetical protein COS09_00100 [Candidatus Nealsonbacteria bacterium CG01_land_8_20_14_3_00_12]